MKIEKIKIKNFKAIKDFEYLPKNKVAVLCATNGTGKTSFLEACRFGLTGNAPINCINDFAEEMSVEVTLEDGLEFSRTKHITKPSKTRVDGKSTTAKNLETVLKDKMRVSKETMKIATSQDVLSSLKPDELGAFLMSYVPEEVDFNTLAGYIPDLSLKARAELEAYFPAMPIRFGLEAVENAYRRIFEARGLASKERANRMAQVDIAALEAPKRALSDLRQEEEEILFKEGVQAAAKTAQELYETALRNRNKAEDDLKALKLQIDTITATKPNDDIIKTIINKKTACNKTITSANSMIAMIQGNLDIFTDTLENLNKPVCPISDKLVCTTDKSKVREEILDLIQANKDGIEIQKSIIQKAKEELAELEDNETAWNNNARAYEHKVALVGRFEAEKKNLPIVPVCPTIIGFTTDFSVRKNELKEEKAYCEAYEKNQKMIREGEALKEKYELLNFLCKALEPKGPVMNGITEAYLSIFESEINKRADELGTGYSVRFISDNGVNYTVKTKTDKAYHSYNDLSHGEQLLAVFLLLDMINKLCGTRIMLLDDVNHLDSNNFNTLFDLICSKNLQDDYDHIFLCAASNADIERQIKSARGVDVIF